jgi:pre-mRNA-splicing factor ATP-dependent RNA helicase DHX32
VIVPLYPKEKCTLFKPVDETEKRSQVYQRRVMLTTSSGESLIWNNTVRFVIDVGVERRKVIIIKEVRQSANHRQDLPLY